MDRVQQITSGDIYLEDLLLDRDFLFRVTNYQRHYVWTGKQVRQFLADGEFCWKQEKEGHPFTHFAGQISLRLKRRDRCLRSEMEIVDGQQRLTTFLLLTARAAQILGLEYGGEQEAEKLWRKYFVSSSKCGPDEERLILSVKDQSFWRQLTGRKERKELDPKTESHRQLYRAAEEIDAFLGRLAEENREQPAEEILTGYVEAVAASFRFIMLTTEQEGYAYALYQTVNDRGVPLTSGELLKARTIELLHDKKEMAEEAEKLWDHILEDSGSVTDKFLGWHYAAVTGRKLETAKGLTIHEQYEKGIFRCQGLRVLSEAEQETILTELRRLKIHVEQMRKLSQGILPEEAGGYASVLYEALIKWLKNTFCIPLYLKILDMEGKNRIRTLNRITPLLAKAFFIAKTMGAVHDTVISNTYLEIWKQIGRERADMDAIQECLERLVQREHAQKEFPEKIKDQVYVRGAGNGKAKFLLLMEELYCLRQVEGQKDEYGDDSVCLQLSKMSVEHILSEDTDPSEVSRAFYEGLHKLGNLTLAGGRLNSRMKNAPFEEKRVRYQRSPYYITREVGQLEHWKRENFEERQKKMTEDLQKAFALREQ